MAKNNKPLDGRKIPKDKRPKPSTGQSAEPRDLPYEALNQSEREIIRMLKSKDGYPVRTIEYLAEAFDSKLEVRNALRRPVSCGWIDNVGRGQYKLSDKGRKRLARA
jgi:hypothetical protein